MKKLESGRSMVEMLGVLAIIGVLSIGGIAGYTMAMNRYKANELLNAASMASVMALSANGGNGISAETDYSTLLPGAGDPAGVTDMKATVTNGVATVTFTAPSTGVADALESIATDLIACTGTTEGSTGTNCTYTSTSN